MLPYTRSIGDYAFKSNAFLKKEQQMLIPTPSIFSLRKQDISMVVLGSSGLWEQTNYVLKGLTEDDL
jgi:serine/threonine protein phosphatase PrpC